MKIEAQPSFFPGYYVLTSERLRALPIKQATHDDVYDLMCSEWWCGLEHYPDGVEVEPGEMGYDQRARYVVVNDA